MLCVRARDIDLIRRDAFALVQRADDLLVILTSVAENIGDDDGVFFLAQL